jgi:hypothetical protein
MEKVIIVLKKLVAIFFSLIAKIRDMLTPQEEKSVKRRKKKRPNPGVA